MISSSHLMRHRFRAVALGCTVFLAASVLQPLSPAYSLKGAGYGHWSAHVEPVGMTLPDPLIENVRTQRGIPLVSKLPYVGRLFEHSSSLRGNRTLLLLVTPRILIQEEE